MSSHWAFAVFFACCIVINFVIAEKEQQTDFGHRADNHEEDEKFTFHFKEMMAMQKDPDAWLDFFFQQLDKHDRGHFYLHDLVNFLEKVGKIANFAARARQAPPVMKPASTFYAVLLDPQNVEFSAKHFFGMADSNQDEKVDRQEFVAQLAMIMANMQEMGDDLEGLVNEQDQQRKRAILKKILLGAASKGHSEF